ncbi:hypothetical protein [Nannocystis pusilla]|uniref:hypothetical protein n=1 Tax=Nannocystis pusilla TaxID=889268 RepID=UPI003B78F93E
MGRHHPAAAAASRPRHERRRHRGPRPLPPLRPAPALERVSIRNLRVGTGNIDLALHRHPEDVGIHILGRRGPVEIVAIK